MSTLAPPVSTLTEQTILPEKARRRASWVGPGLVLPAALVTIIFSLLPLGYLIIVSLTNKSDFFFADPVYSLNNYRLVFDRYLPNVMTTIRLGTLASLLNLVFGYPFAYILIRKVRYRELVR